MTSDRRRSRQQEKTMKTRRMGRRAPWVLALFVALLMTGILPSPARGAQFVIPPYPTTNRTNLCPRMGRLVNGTLTAANVLQGLQLRVAITQAVPKFSMLIANSTGQPYGGYMYNVLQQVAARTGATFSYMLVPPYPGPPMDYKIWMKRILRYTDLLADMGYSDAVDARASGIGFVRGVLDQSLVLVTTTRTTNQLTDFFTFLEPFSHNLWAYFAGVIFFNGFVHYFVDPFNFAGTDKPTPFYRMFYLAFGTFTGVENLVSNTASGNILYTGYGFFIMIMVASYTANLASTLVTTSQSAKPVTSISNANDLQASVCVQAGSAAYNFINAKYTRIDLVQIYSMNPVDVLAGIAQNKCDSAVVGQADWDVYSQTKAGNPGCALYVAGPTVQPVHAAWPYLIDYGCGGGPTCYCTSVLESAMSYAITSLKADNTLFDLKATETGLLADQACSPKFAPPQPSTQLTVYQLGGIFLLYGISFAAGLVVWIGEEILNRCILKRNPNTETCGMSKKELAALSQGENAEDSGDEIPPPEGEGVDGISSGGRIRVSSGSGPGSAGSIKGGGGGKGRR